VTRSTYATRGSEKAEALVGAVFDLGSIGYIALNSGQEVLMRLAPGVATSTTEESNFFEELLVNPALLKLASHRGGLDCGGLDYIAIGYGDFTQLIMLTKDGHISMGVERTTDPGKLAARISSVLEQHGQAWVPPAPWLLA